MVNLFDIVRQAQSGRGLELLSRQFGLSLEQTHLALEALLPAVSMGLQRSARNPNAFAGLVEAMTSGRYAPFWTGAPVASSPSAQLVDQIFGSRDVGGRVAAQASAATGIAVQVLQAMLPQIAGMVVGGLNHFATVEGFSDFLRAWADWLRRFKPPEPARGQADVASPYRAWSDMMASMTGAPPARPQPPKPAAVDPWTSFTQAFLAGSQPAPPPPKPPAAEPNPFAMLSQMFETGRDIQAQHMAGLQTIFDGFWGTGRER